MTDPIESPLISVKRLRKWFGDRLLLDIADVEFASGQLTVLLGDNGSGKTTLLRILAGLESARGERDLLDAKWGETPFTSTLPEGLRGVVTYVHQHPYLFHTSIVANIAYGLKLRGVDPQSQTRAVEEAVAWAGLGSVLSVPPRRLSGGEKQRVALARAKVLAPTLWLIDEPTANLDRAARAQIVQLLRDSAIGGACVVVATHDPEITALEGARRLRLESGKLLTA